MTFDQALADLQAAREALYGVLKGLEGKEQAQGIRKALAAGVPATELAQGLGISRAWLYQIKER